MKGPFSFAHPEFSMPDGLRALMFASCLCALLLNCALEAEPRADDVIPLLEGYEWTLEPQRFACMGKGVDSTLRAIAVDATLPNYYRLRALTALGLFPNTQTESFLQQVIADDGFHPSQVQSALHAYERAFGAEHPKRVVALARRTLAGSDDYQVQIAAATTLAHSSSPEAKAVLRGYLDSGLSDVQRQQIEYMLREPKSSDMAGRGVQSLRKQASPRGTSCR